MAVPRDVPLFGGLEDAVLDAVWVFVHWAYEMFWQSVCFVFGHRPECVEYVSMDRYRIRCVRCKRVLARRPEA